MRQILIYKAERDAGLTERIYANATLAYTSRIELVEKTPETTEKIKALAKNYQALATNEGQIDLHYMKSILVTVGWNKNDDVFDKAETWAARSTSEDKPLNYEHNPNDIIGHITGNYVIDLTGKIIANDTVVDDLPDSFHIVNTEVIYKYHPEKEKLERIEKLIAEIGEGKWFVSMEALFDSFDYAVQTPDGENRIIARNEESAFLTKHLRAYGGTGEYENAKIGRLVRNIIFSGKGLVLRPANPDSIIFDNVKAFHKVTASSIEEFTKVKQDMGYTFHDSKTSNQERKIMAADVTQVDILNDNIKRLEQTVTAATKRAEEAEKRLAEMNEQTVKAKLDTAASDIKTRDEKITSLNEQVKVEQNARTQAETKVNELTAKLSELEAKLTKVEADSKKVGRINVISTELGMNQADATKFYDEHVADLNLGDERFVKLVATFKAHKAPATQQTQTQNDSTQAALDNAQPNGKAAPLGSAGVQNTTTEQVRAGLANFLGSNILSGTKNKKKTGDN
jgi:hypothetical protein